MRFSRLPALTRPSYFPTITRPSYLPSFFRPSHLPFLPRHILSHTRPSHLHSITRHLPSLTRHLPSLMRPSHYPLIDEAFSSSITHDRDPPIFHHSRDHPIFPHSRDPPISLHYETSPVTHETVEDVSLMDVYRDEGLVLGSLDGFQVPGVTWSMRLMKYLDLFLNAYHHINLTT